jgi:hypothetical protein
MGGWVGCEVWADRWVEREQNQRFYKDEVFQGGGCGFSSLMKQKKRG